MFKDSHREPRRSRAPDHLCAAGSSASRPLPCSRKPTRTLHRRFADEDVCIGPARSADSYLNVPSVITRRKSPAPTPSTPDTGSSRKAPTSRRCARRLHPVHRTRPAGDSADGRQGAGAPRDEEGRPPVLPGSDGPVESEEKALKVAKDIGYPVIVKATAGGGGRGMRVVRAAGELSHAVKTAQREAEAAFGVGDVYLEKIRRSAAPYRVPDPRRSPRIGHPPGRARVLDPAAPSEADRGVAVAGAQREVAPQDGRHRHRRGQGRAVHQRGHLRIPDGSGWPVPSWRRTHACRWSIRSRRW